MSHASKQVGNVLGSLYRELSPEAKKMMEEVFSKKDVDHQKIKTKQGNEVTIPVK